MSTYEYGISGTAAMGEGEGSGLALDTVVRVTGITASNVSCRLPIGSVTLKTEKDNVRVSFDTFRPEDFTALDRYRLVLKKVE